VVLCPLHLVNAFRGGCRSACFNLRTVGNVLLIFYIGVWSLNSDEKFQLWLKSKQ